jgi:GDP-mannose transporter
MLMINKLCVHHFPYPSTITITQLVFSIIFIYTLKFMGMIKVDPLTFEKAKPYTAYVAAFAAGLYTNMKALEVSNIETLIIFRAASPLVVALLDTVFMGRALPSPRSWVALGALLGGCFGYTWTDEAVNTMGLSAYLYPSLYLVFICFQMTYGKKILQQVPMETFWGPVLYNNVLCLPFLLVFLVQSGEIGQLMEKKDVFALGPSATFYLLMGCIVGTAIGYSGWYCRAHISATSFTLVGVVNKCITMTVNVAIWDQHASASGLLALLIALMGSTLYEQSPMRDGYQPLARVKEVSSPAQDDAADTADDDSSTTTSRIRTTESKAS